VTRRATGKSSRGGNGGSDASADGGSADDDDGDGDDGPKFDVGSVCEPDYNAFFQMAVDQIDKSCDEYVPPAG